VLSANPLETDPEALPEIRVQMTFLAGKRVWEA
jgi:predicted amidohydrolase YtcJ